MARRSRQELQILTHLIGPNVVSSGTLVHILLVLLHRQLASRSSGVARKKSCPRRRILEIRFIPRLVRSLVSLTKTQALAMLSAGGCRAARMDSASGRELRTGPERQALSISSRRANVTFLL